MFENNILCGNQQPSPKGKVQRLGRNAVGPSGPKWGATEQNAMRFEVEDIVLSYVKA